VPADRRPRPWRTLLAYALVALAAAASNVAIRRAGLPVWAGYAAAAIVIVAVIGGMERRRAQQAARRDPDLRLLRAEGSRDDVLDRLRALERAGRPKAGVGVAMPPGECKLWIRHVEDAFEIHAFSVSASDQSRLQTIDQTLQRTPGSKRLATAGPLEKVLTYRVTLPAEAVHRLVLELLDQAASSDAPVELWWSTTLGDMPGEP